MIACWPFVASTCILVLLLVFVVGAGIRLGLEMRQADPLDFLGRERLP